MGTIVIGKVESGTCRKGDDFLLMPNKQKVRVIGITGADETEKSTCRAGENVKLKLSGVEVHDSLITVPKSLLTRFFILCVTSIVTHTLSPTNMAEGEPTFQPSFTLSYSLSQ